MDNQKVYVVWQWICFDEIKEFADEKIFRSEENALSFIQKRVAEILMENEGEPGFISEVPSKEEIKKNAKGYLKGICKYRNCNEYDFEYFTYQEEDLL